MRNRIVLIIGLLMSASSGRAAIILSDDFQDGNITAPNGAQGMTWVVDQGDAPGFGIPHNGGTTSLFPAVGSIVRAQQTISKPEYTLIFDAGIEWSDPSRIIVLYKDANNYYAVGLGQYPGIYRVMDGVEKGIASDLGSFFRSPHESMKMRGFKVYVKNDGNTITIKAGRLDSGCDYDYSAIDQDATALTRFSGATTVGIFKKSGSEPGWTALDNVKVDDTFVQNIHTPVTVYVDATLGDDTRSYQQAQNESTPWKTMQNAANNIYGGDTVIVKPGNYPERVIFANRHVSGRADNRTTFRSVPVHGASIYGFITNYTDYLNIQDFDVTAPPVLPDWTWGTFIYVGSHYVDVSGNYFHDIPATAVGTSGVCDKDPEGCARHVTIKNNRMYLCQFGVVTSGDDVLIENNDIERIKQYSTDGDSDFTRFFGSSVTFRGNHMHGARREELPTAHVDGFQTFDNNGEYARHILIENNVVEDYFDEGVMAEAAFHQWSYDIVFRNNVFKDSASWSICFGQGFKDVKIDHNVIYRSPQLGLGSSGELKNNIFIDSDYTPGPNVVASNNLLYSTRLRNNPQALYDPKAHPNDVVNKDPLFVDEQNEDFHLQAISPAIDAGALLSSSAADLDKDGQQRPYGNAPDIGMYEYHGEFDGKPQAVIQANKLQGYDPLLVHLDGSLSYERGGMIQNYLWKFDDGTTATTAKVDHTFHEGTHAFSLTVTDAGGLSETSSQQVQVRHSAYPNLYLFLPLDGNILDMSGKGNQTTWDGPAAFSDGLICKSAAINTTSMINVANSEDLDGLEQTTFSFWAKRNVATAAATVLYKHTVYQMNLSATGFSAGIAGANVGAAGGVDTNWHHYAATWDGSTVRLYLDGKEVASQASTAPMGRGYWWGVAIGGDPWGARFNGSMDDIRIYDRFLSAGEIADLYAKGVTNTSACIDTPPPAADLPPLNPKDAPPSHTPLPQQPGTTPGAAPSSESVYGFVPFKNMLSGANPKMEINLLLKDPAHVRLELFDRKGHSISKLIDDDRPAGPVSVVWDGKNASGSPVTSGFYLLRLQAGDLKQTKKIVVVR